MGWLGGRHRLVDSCVPSATRNSVLLRVPCAEVKKKTSPSTPRDFFEKLYGHLDSSKGSVNDSESKFVKSQSKLLNLKIHQPLPLKFVSSQSSGQSCEFTTCLQNRCVSGSGEVHAKSTTRINESLLEDESSDCDIDVESGSEATSKVVINDINTEDAFNVRHKEEHRDINQTLKESSTDSSADDHETKFHSGMTSQNISSWKSDVTETVGAKNVEDNMKSLPSSPSYAMHLPPMALSYQQRAEEHHSFFLRPFLGTPHEGPFPPGFTAFFFVNQRWMILIDTGLRPLKGDQSALSFPVWPVVFVIRNS
ncbi:hypothetical protein J6590_064961 [Homalodisca vitripennis]|nr:hypothetical protein J6590_064961 [Homalodisca vitripennis]